MKASAENPVYTVTMVDGSTQYDLTPALEEIDFSDEKDQIAMSANIGIMNVQVNGKWMSSILQVRQRIFIYANDGEKKEEVFRGFIWTKYYKSATGSKTITIRCYDNLIYFQESEDSQYFSSGKSTTDVMSSICNDWGISLAYNYSSITHGKLVLRGALADIITSDILDSVKDQTGQKYVVLSIKDVLTINPVGSNTTVYTIEQKRNAVTTRSEFTMDGMITKVVILGKADKSERKPVQATVTGNTSQYGTLQKIVDKNENTSLADAKKEANNLIQEYGSPEWSCEVQAHDIPWIRKGDKVVVNAGDLANQTLIVAGIARNISNKSKTMSLTLERQ